MTFHKTKVEANDVQPREVRCGHSSCETCEQRAATRRGADGAKGRSQGESGRPKHAPCAETGKHVTGG